MNNELIDIFLRDLDDNPMRIRISARATLEELRKEIKKFTDIEGCELYFRGRRLQHGTLAERGIKNLNTIVLNTKYLGGGRPSLTFNKMEDVRHLEFSETAPEWRRVSRGISFYGKCENKSCQAFGQQVFDSKGFGVFNTGIISPLLT